MEGPYIRKAGNHQKKTAEKKKKDSQKTAERNGKPETAKCAVKKHKRRKVKRRLICAAAAIILLAAWLNGLYAKSGSAAANKEAERLAVKLVNSAILETLTECENSGMTSGITQQRVNGDGVGFLYIDAAKLNIITSKMIERIGSEIAALSSSGIGIPLGTVSGIAALNGVGPELNASIRPIGSVSREFTSEFSAAGVNQTKYSAAVELRLEFLVLFGGRETLVEVSCMAPLVETVIVGGVPHAYTDVSSFEDALNLIPTDAD